MGDLRSFRGRWWLDNPAKDREESSRRRPSADYPQPHLILKAMFSLKRLSGLLLGSFLVVSCTPLPPFEPAPGPGPVTAEAQPVSLPKTPEQIKEEERKRQERIKANEEARKRREALEAEKNERIKPIESGTREPVKPPSKYRTAMPIPGKPGFVYNPWTNRSVDVRGIPSGTLIRDPNDGDPTHKFRVP
jgi:hypothetical protein